MVLVWFARAQLLRFVAEKEGCCLLSPESTKSEVEENIVEMKFTDENGAVSHIHLERVVIENASTEGTELAKWISGEKDPTVIFNKFDVDGSGEIDRNELRCVFDEIGRGVTDRELDRVFVQFDVDNSGSIEIDEFMDFLSQLKDEINESTFKMTFMALKGEQKPWRAMNVGKVEFKMIYNPVNAERGEGTATNETTLNR